MPTYTFRNKKSLDVVEKFLSFKEREEFLTANPEFEQIHLDMAAVCDVVRLGLKKPDQAFRDILRQRKARHPRSNINVP